jgi:deferrochelatase/peroxidase EfeB
MTGVRKPSRRQVLTASMSIAATAGLAGWPGPTRAETPTPAPPGGTDAVLFFDTHQAGITTPAQDRLVFAAFDFKGTQISDLRRLMRTWSDASAAMAEGQPVPGVSDTTLAPPTDTGEAAGLSAAHLTITFGFGPSLFDDRLGLSGWRPGALADLPALPGDRLVASLSGGDLCVQACADDPQVAFHAVRNLVRLGRGLVSVRWMQLGFGRTSTTSTRQSTPRNLMGFKDGTNNLKAEDTASLSAYVWIGDDADQAWLRGGSYLVARRIRMRIESWDRVSLQEQERIIGRHKTSGAPLTGDREFDAVDLQAAAADGDPVIDPRAHIRLVTPDSNAGVRILRRGYSFTDGIDQSSGELDAGLFFICFQRDPATGFVALQRRLAASDSLNEYIRHTGSAVFACPPGAQRGDYVGSGLLQDLA